MSSPRKFWSSPLAPIRFAIVWLFFAWMRLLVLLPLRAQLAICMAVGGFTGRLIRRRRRIVDTNLALCFPELSTTEREHLTQEHFRSLGASLAEMAMGWYGPVDEIRRRVTIVGLEHLQAGLDRGRGVILFSGHFTSFEIFFPVLAPLCPRFCGMYKEQTNPSMNRIMTAGRMRNVDEVFAKDNPRQMLRALAKNSVAWYASDQSFAEKGAALIPFFGEPAMTNTAISRIARISGATVLPYFPLRLPGQDRYRLTIAPPLPDFPSDDPIEDTRRLTEQLESFVREAPEQYWWVHQRFKARPSPYPDVYAATGDTA
jgi:KDO2-lipid IV(A) lauroyltransferase